MHDPREQHLVAIKRILCYLKGTLCHGLQLYSSSSDSMVTYIGADWVGCPDTRHFMAGFYVFF
jgi:hypothetical protein